MTPEAFQTTYENAATGPFADNTTRDIDEPVIREFAKDVRETFTPREGSGLDTSSKLEDDFIAGPYSIIPGFTMREIASGAGAKADHSTYGMNNTENCQGVASIETGSTNTGLCYLSTSGGTVKINSSTKITLTMRMGLETLGNVTDRYSVNFGLILSSNENIGFQYADNVNSGKWQAVTTTGGVSTTTDTGITADTLFSIFTIEVINNTSVKFYINGVLVATHTTNIPSGATVRLPVQFQITKSVGTTTRLLHSDYYSLTVSRTAAR